MTEPNTEAEAQGIDQQLDAGVVSNDHEPDIKPEDARTSQTLRTDPDDPAKGMQAADEASKSSEGAAPEQG